MKKIVIFILLGTLVFAEDAKVNQPTLCDYYTIEGWKTMVGLSESTDKKFGENHTKGVIKEFLEYEDARFNILSNEDKQILSGCSFRKWCIENNKLK